MDWRVLKELVKERLNSISIIPKIMKHHIKDESVIKEI